MTRISVPGVPDPVLEEEPAGTGEFLEASTEYGLRIDATRGAPAARSVIEDAEPDDVVELRLEGGVRRWVAVADLTQELALPRERGGEDGTISLPSSLSVGDATRGVDDWAISGLRLLRAKVVGAVVEKGGPAAAVKLATGLENKLVPEERLGRVRGGQLELGAAPRASEYGTDPFLLFIHGTASRTGSAFAGLGSVQGGRSWEALERSYGSRILAYDHRTLTRSPVENAIALVRALGKEARLHVVSHSRGGIVGELLCRGRRIDRRMAFSEDELKLMARAFEGRPGAAEELEAVRELTALLAEKRISVERFVPVGSPLRGTDLAGGKIDRWASIVLNLLDRLAGLTGNPVVTTVAEFTTAFLLSMVKARGDWTALPGLAAQMPESPLLRLLNVPGTRVEGQLSAIAGDSEPDGILRRLAIWTADVFYGEDSDFVVQTSSMRGGADRGEEGRHFTTGPQVGRTIHHCNYFATPETVQALEGALRGVPDEVGFQPIRRHHTELTEADIRSRNSDEPRPVVFVLPGIMGSHLAVEGDRVWLDVLKLMFGGMRELEIGDPEVRPDRLVGRVYDDVTRYLQTSHDVRRFPYDWRQSLVEEADRLAEEVRAALASTQEPIRFLAHSMGGLLVRTMIARHPELWRDVCARTGGRLVMLGTPNHGSFSITRVLLGVDRTLKMLALLDLPTGRTGILEVISRFPGLLELLPRPTADQDLLSVTAWKELLDAVRPGEPDWLPPRQEDLIRASETRALLDASPVDPDHMCYVAGWAPETPSGVAVQEGRIQFFGTHQGDGQVTWDMGIPPALRDSRTWFMNVAHGDLPAHRPGFAALHDLLVHGRTDRLSRTPPATRGLGPEGDHRLPDDQVTTFPDQDDLTRTVMGMGAVAEPVAPEPAIRVSVCHGDVGFARHHVVVGHYTGDLIVSAEGALDRWLDGELSVRHASGLYPGPLETAAVVFNLPGRPLKGAVVVGLGGVGGLSAGGLERTLTAGILRLAANIRDRARERGEEPPETFGISPVLIGTGEGGISLTATLRATLSAALEANRLLGLAPWHGRVRLGEIQFVELYLDQALEATGTLARIAADIPGSIAVEAEVTARRGGRTRPYASEDGQWSWRLQIQGDPDPGAQRLATDSLAGAEGEEAMTSLRFTVPTIRASASSSTLAADRHLVDRLLDEATTSTRTDPELGETLFELLVPNEVKDQAPEKRDLLLLVDEGAARYPWELLKDPSVPGEPVAIEAQMIRQLVTDQGRRGVTAATGSRMLVIGDPADTHLSPLSGAEAEARDVTRLFSETPYEVREIIHGTHSQIVRALFSSRRGRDLGYRVIHIAAHGEFDAEGRGESGVVIGDHLYLTPHTFNQLRHLPELVFLNCCHLGRMEERRTPWRPNRIAANLGTQLIRMGVKAVVVAGWAVNDAAARTFSREFYGRMLRGDTFGSAVLHAREATWNGHRESNTWGAYQCYGDPQFTLPGGGLASADWRPSFYHPSMAVTELRNLSSRARTLRLHTTAALGEDLDRIVEAIPPAWMDHSDVAEALGLVYGELGHLEEALSHLERAVRCDRPQASVASQEKWGNYRARLSARSWLEEDQAVDDDEGRETRRGERLQELGAAIARIEALVDLFGPSTERLNLLGSAHKRKAVVVPVRERMSILAESQERYREARRHALDTTGTEDFLALANCLAISAVRRLRGGGGAADDAEFRRMYDAAQSLILHGDEELHPFFGTSAPAELELVRALRGGTLDQEVEAIGDGYEAAFKRAGSVRELASTLDQLVFHIEMLRTDTDEAAGLRIRNRRLREAAVPALRALQQRLAGLTG